MEYLKYLDLSYLPNEEWRDIKDYEGLYQVSNLGRIKSFARKDRLGRPVYDRILKQSISSYGYCVVTLHKNGKARQRLVHRLVLEVFSDNPYNKPYINHVNGVKTCNVINNLEYCTHAENIIHSFRVLKNKPNSPWLGKFGYNNSSSKPVVQHSLNGEYIMRFASAIEVIRETGIGRTGICSCCRGRIKSSGGFIWKYE